MERILNSGMTSWVLPDKAVLGGKEYAIYTDYRDILEIFSCFEDPDLTDRVKWQIALERFYKDELPDDCLQEAMEFLADFVRGGRQCEERPAPKLFDWEQDASVIIAEVNKVSGQEIRALPYVHWWTFLSWFHGIGEGQLSLLVGIREKLRKGKKLDAYEAEYYREHKSEVDLKTRYSRQELAQRQALERLLGE